jgi:hypothetical protein
MVTLLVVPSPVSAAIAAATSIEECASIAQSIPASSFTANNRTPLDACGVFECLTKALELTHAGVDSAPAKRVVASFLTALVSGSRAHGMIVGDSRARVWSEGHVWNPIATGSLGGVLTGVYDTQRALRKAAETLTPEGAARVRSLVFSIDSILKAVVYRPEQVDLSDFDDLADETF